MIHTNMPPKGTVFLLPRRLTRSAIYGGQIFDSHKWPTVLVRTVKENHAISRQICVDHCILLLQHLSNHMHFITNGYKRFFIDQLDRSKATCSFKREQRFVPNAFIIDLLLTHTSRGAGTPGGDHPLSHAEPSLWQRRQAETCSQFKIFYSKTYIFQKP